MSVLETFVPIRSTPTRPLVRRQEQRMLITGLLVVDTCSLLLSFVLAYAIRFQLYPALFDDGVIKPSFYATTIAAIVPAYLALFYVYGLYNRADLLGGTLEYAKLFNAISTGMLLIIFINFIQPQFVVARAWLLLSWVLMLALGMTTRFIARRVVYAQRTEGRYRDRTLIVGANPEGMAVAEQLKMAPTSGAQIVGFVDDYLPVGSEPIPGVPVLGSAASFASLVTLQSIDTAVVANTAISRERLLGIYAALDTLPDVEVRLASGLFELLTTGMRIREEGNVPLIVLNKTRITGIHLVCKTVLDYTLAASALLVFLPFFLVMTYLVKRDSPGPVIYRRRVVGQGRREFDAFKFRTMRMEGDALLSPDEKRELEQHGKLREDPRVTPSGAFLRRFSLDELPQLLNVLRGEMSLIGPRMITMKELEKFGKWQHNLATVKPGLTGLWQISGRSDLSYEERVRLDMHYIRNHSIWLDLRILVMTVPALVTGRGAY